MESASVSKGGKTEKEINPKEIRNRYCRCGELLPPLFLIHRVKYGVRDRERGQGWGYSLALEKPAY